MRKLEKRPAERWRADEYRHTPFDLLIFLLGEPLSTTISRYDTKTAHGVSVFPTAEVHWELSTDPYLEPTRSIVIDDSVFFFFYAGIHRATRAKLLSDIDRQRLHAARCAACFRYGDGDEVTLRGL